MIYSFIGGVIVGILLCVADILKHGKEAAAAVSNKVAPERNKVEILDHRTDDEKIKDNFQV